MKNTVPNGKIQSKPKVVATIPAANTLIIWDTVNTMFNIPKNLKIYSNEN